MCSDKLNSSKGDQFIRFLFLGWLLTLPFGANILSVSLGFMTIYPNFIFSLALLPFGLLTFKKWSLSAKLISFFLVGWIAYASVQLLSTAYTSAGIFDLRSLIMQCVFALLLFSSYYRLGKVEFQRLLVIGLRSFLTVIVLFGVFEYYTGIHFAGATTAQFPDMVIGNTFYAPLFIYDNPNDYLTYALFVFIVLNLFDQSFRENKYIGIIVLIILFVFAQNADSKFARLAICVLMLLQLSLILQANRHNFSLKKIFPFLITMVLLFVMFFSKTIFYGPKYSDSKKYRLNAIELLERNGSKIEIEKAMDVLSKREQIQVIEYLDSVNTKSPDVAVNLRKNLILNGLDFIKEKPFFGIGPGGYHNRIEKGDFNHFIHKHVSPHNFPIEIISQFGIVGCLYLFIVLGLFLIILKSFRFYLSSNPWIYALFILLPVFWMMPSAYLYLDIHWLFLPIVVIFIDITSKQRKNVVEQ